MTIREQLQTLLQSHSMREIGRAAGVTHHTVSKFANGSSIKLESFKKIEIAVTNLTQLDAQKVVWTAGVKAGALATPCTKQAQIADLIARLAAADVEREQIMRKCNAQADNLWTYQERVALLEYENNVHKEALTLAESIAVAHDQQAVDLCHDHALTIERLNKNTDDLKHQKRMAAQLLSERDAVNVERLHLKSECQRMAADSLFLQGLRIGFKYTAVLLVLLLIVAAVCWFGGV